MTIRITWSDPNGPLTQEEEVRIYRDTAPFDAESLPSVLVTLAADVTTYDDTTAIPDTSYWYAVGFEKDGRVVITTTSQVYIVPGLVTENAAFFAATVSQTTQTLLPALFSESAAFFAPTVATGEVVLTPALFSESAEFFAATVDVGELTFTLTVPSGTVSADLTNFPLMIDLAEMPSGFWTAVRSDGGNVRAYASDGVTQIPIDLTYINKTRELGRMFVKTGLLTASDNTVAIKVLAPTETALAVTDAYGRNAVWSDFEVVWVFPSDTNRTGKSHTQSMASLLAHSEWMRTGYDNLTGSPHNGISTDGTHFIGCDDIILRRMNMSYVVQQTVTDINTALSAMTGLSNFDHMGDPVCVGTSTFFTVTTDDGTYRRFLVEYTTATLTLLNAWEMTGGQREFGATVCYDGTNLLLFSFYDDTKFIKYTTSGSYVGDVSITGRPSEMDDYQGSVVMPGGNIYVSGGTNGIYEITPAGAYVQKVYTDPHSSIMEGLDHRDGNLWLLKGNGALITLRNDVHPDFRYLHQNDRAYATLPNAQTWSMGAVLRQVRDDFQHTYIGLNNSTPADAARSSLGYRNGNDVVALWNSTDTWLETTISPDPYETIAVGAAHNGTTQRKVHARKGSTGNSAVDNTISARPTGTNMDFLMNSGGRSTAQDGANHYQYVWLRLDYVSDAWFVATQKMMLEPATFYTIT